jgi:hypothetical protein
MTERRFNELVQKAAIRNKERDDIERSHGNASPSDCDIDVHVATALEALRSAMLAPSDDILAEAYDILRLALERLRSGAALTSRSSTPTARASPWPSAGEMRLRGVSPTPTRRPGPSRS